MISSVWPTILDSSWNNVINDISAQTLYPQDLSDNNLRFYKGVYLEPVIQETIILVVTNR